jgi:hypothetical protein
MAPASAVTAASDAVHHRRVQERPRAVVDQHHVRPRARPRPRAPNRAASSPACHDHHARQGAGTGRLGHVRRRGAPPPPTRWPGAPGTGGAPGAGWARRPARGTASGRPPVPRGVRPAPAMRAPGPHAGHRRHRHSASTSSATAAHRHQVEVDHGPGRAPGRRRCGTRVAPPPPGVARAGRPPGAHHPARPRRRNRVAGDGTVQQALASAATTPASDAGSVRRTPPTAFRNTS